MDFLNALIEFLYKNGFQRIDVEGKLLFVKEGKTQLSLIEILPERLPGQRRVEFSQYEREIYDIERQLMLKNQKKVRNLFLIVRPGEPDRTDIDEAAECPDVWFLDRKNGEIILYERQREDYCGLRRPMEEFLVSYLKEKKAEDKRELRYMLTPVNTGLVVVNVFVFLFLSFLGDPMDAGFMASHGAMTWESIVEKGQYYRLFTSMFLHFGADHLLQNMLILTVLGCRLERITGKFRYAMIYLGSGLAGALLSLLYTLRAAPFSVSAGASGAIFGVMGGLVFLLLSDVVRKRRQRVEEIGLPGIIFVVVSALSYGFFSTGVDNAAHLGGLVGGFLLTMFFMMFEHEE